MQPVSFLLHLYRVPLPQQACLELKNRQRVYRFVSCGLAERVGHSGHKLDRIAHRFGEERIILTSLFVYSIIFLNVGMLRAES